MDCILIVCKNFTFKHQVAYLKNGVPVSTHNVAIGDIPLFAVNLAKNNKVNIVNISGNAGFTNKIKENIKTYENKTFNENTLQINLI